MRRSPTIVPAQLDDRDVYLVLNDYGERLGRAWVELPEDDTSCESVIRDLMRPVFRACSDRCLQYSRALVS